MRRSKKAETSPWGAFVAVLIALAILAVAYQGAKMIKKTGDNINSANSCESTLGGKCIGQAQSCSSYAPRGHGCPDEKPFCCQDERFDKCVGAWNTCETCQVATLNAVYLGSTRNGEPFKVKCAYNVDDVPCAKMTLSGRGTVLAPDFCKVNEELSSDGEIVYDCPGTLLPGDYTIACNLNAKGAAGVNSQNTCCAASANKDVTANFTIR